MDAKELGRRLAEIRQESGFSQEQLAYQLAYHGIKLTQQSVAKWEARGNIRAIELATISEVLNKPISEFYKPPSEIRF